MVQESGTVSVLKPLDGLIIPLHSPEREDAIRRRIVEYAQRLIHDEEDLTERAGLLINTMTILGRLNLPTMDIGLPTHFMPDIHNAFLVVPEQRTGVPSGLIVDHLRQAREEERSRGIVYLASGASDLQFRTAEHSISFDLAVKRHDAKIIVIFPLKLERFGFREITPPAAVNGVIDTVVVNHVTRKNLVRFLMQNTPFADY